MEYFRFEFCLFCFDFCFVFSAVLFSNFTFCVIKRFAVNCKVFYVSSLHFLGYSVWPQFIEKCEKFILWLQHQSQPHTELAIKNGNGQWKCEHEKLSQKYATSVAKPQRGEKRRVRRRERGMEEEAFWQCIKYAPVWPVHRGSPEDIRWHSPHHRRLLRQPLQLLLLLHLLRLPHPAVPYKRALWHWAESIKAGKTTLWLSSFCNGTKSETTTASAKYIAPKNNCMKNQRAHELAD